MLSHHAFWHLTEASFALVIVAAIGAVGVWQGKRGRRVEAKMDQALSNQETGNDKDIGATVHDLAQTSEVIVGQLHTNTRELLTLGDRFDTHLLESKQIHREILDRIPEKAEGA